MAVMDLTAVRLRQLLQYDPVTGVFSRSSDVGGRYGRPGPVLGSLDRHGHVRITLESKRYFAHRLAWLYVHGQWPLHEIDHINGVRNDNRILNLRDVTSSVNHQNLRGARKANKTGFLGVCRIRDNCYRAEIKVEAGKTTYLGRFKTPELAHEAYLVAKRALHPGCTI